MKKIKAGIIGRNFGYKVIFQAKEGIIQKKKPSQDPILNYH